MTFFFLNIFLLRDFRYLTGTRLLRVRRKPRKKTNSGENIEIPPCRKRLAADANTLLSPVIVSTDGARRTTAVLRYHRPLAFPRRTCCAINCRPCPHVFAQEPSLRRCASDLTAGVVHGTAITIESARKASVSNNPFVRRKQIE